MPAPMTLAQWLQQRCMDSAQLAESTKLEQRVVDAILASRYTTSPAQRQRIADALDVKPDDIQWSSTVGVDHMYGHGPQFGRSP